MNEKVDLMTYPEWLTYYKEYCKDDGRSSAGKVQMWLDYKKRPHGNRTYYWNGRQVYRP